MLDESVNAIDQKSDRKISEIHGVAMILSLKLCQIYPNSAVPETRPGFCDEQCIQVVNVILSLVVFAVDDECRVIRVFGRPTILSVVCDACDRTNEGTPVLSVSNHRS